MKGIVGKCLRWLKNTQEQGLRGPERGSAEKLYLRFMRVYILILFAVLPLVSMGQKEITLRKKYLGAYKGTIPAYKMDTGDEVVEVSSAAIAINLTPEDVTISIGNNSLHGKYTVMFEAKDYYLLDVVVDGQLANERIMVYKHGKHLSRDGMYPQPVAELNKY